ncbi:MAG: hypothetical protein RLZZ22_1333 [Pseudomonadota bacterium]|jgi:hypothetical protein
MAENKKPKPDTDNASATLDVGNASGSADVGNASGTANVPPAPDDDPLSDANLDDMHNTGTTWGRYRNRR